MKIGDTLLLDDGYLMLEVTDVNSTDVTTRVVNGGTLKDRKGINLPNVAVSSPALTQKGQNRPSVWRQSGS